MEQEDQTYTRTENGCKAFSKEHFLKDEQSSLVALNVSLVNKDDFAKVEPYLQKILEGDNQIAKVYAMVLMVHTRDIEFGKGLRKPFLAALMFLYQKGYKNFVLKLLEDVPEFGYYKDLCNIFMMAEEGKFEELSEAATQVYLQGLQKEFDEENANKMTNCAKFAPRQQKKFDKFAKKLAKTMFPGQKDALKQYRDYVGKIMRKYKQITEVLMSAKQWDDIDPKYVPSLCFQKYKKCFLKEQQDDEKRMLLKTKYEQHIKKAVKQEDGCKINAKRLTVDKVIEEIISYKQKTELEELALEAQMIDIVNDLKKNGEGLRDCVAVCDVSGSMSGNPMNACIGLGVAMNAINAGRYANTIISFDDNPTWVDMTGCETYVQAVKKLQAAPWGGSTNFEKTMELVSQMGKTKEELPKAVFVFSDMQFNQATGRGDWDTGFESIVKMYQERGFTEDDIPTIIFWNLRGNNNFTVDAHQRKVIQISGFSQSLIKNITTAPDIDYILNLTPFTFLLETLNNERYNKVFQLAQDSVQK